MQSVQAFSGKKIWQMELNVFSTCIEYLNLCQGIAVCTFFSHQALKGRKMGKLIRSLLFLSCKTGSLSVQCVWMSSKLVIESCIVDWLRNCN